MNFSKFVLGTANLGATYGIKNHEEYNGDVSRGVITHALARGIATFDTAAEYGKAEELLGTTINPDTGHQIVTKIPARAAYTYDYVLQSLQLSLIKLKQNKIYGLMFHDPDIHKRKEIQEISNRLLETGLVEHIGFSAYSLDALLNAKEQNPSWTIFQVPENILDRRLINSTELSEMAKAKNIIYVRSTFLQGLLLSSSLDIPNKFKKYKQVFHELHVCAEQNGVNALDLCLSYSFSISWSAGVVVAAATIDQLDEILDFRFLNLDFDKLEKLPEQILDPRRWSELK